MRLEDEKDTVETDLRRVLQQRSILQDLRSALTVASGQAELKDPAALRTVIDNLLLGAVGGQHQKRVDSEPVKPPTSAAAAVRKAAVAPPPLVTSNSQESIRSALEADLRYK